MKPIYLLLLLPFLASPLHSLVIHTSDFIATNERIHFNGFESRSGSQGFHSEGGIVVEQINGQNDITSLNRNPTFEGNGAWYPNGGDFGFTKITLADGSAFQNIGMLVGSGFSTPTNLYFELHLDGSLVASHNLTSHSQGYSYLGVSDATFDEILLRDSSQNTTSLSGGVNALALDSIEVSSSISNPGQLAVPEPSSLLLLLVAVIGIRSAVIRG